MVQKIKKLLSGHSFLRNVSVLAGGTVAGQAIVVFASPLLARLYQPQDFGLLAVYAALLSIIGVIASLRYQLAIPLPESDEDAAHIVLLSMLLVMFISLVVTLVVLLFAEPVAFMLKSPVLNDYFYLLPVGVLLLGGYQVFMAWGIRTKAFSAVSRTKLNQAISMITVQVAGYAVGPVALLVGHIMGQAVGCTSLVLLCVKTCRKCFLSFRLKKLFFVANKYRGFPLVSVWAGLCGTGGSQLPPILIAGLLDPRAAGIYAFASRVMSVPMATLGKAVGDVFYAEAPQAFAENRLGILVLKVNRHLAMAAMPVAAFLFVSVPHLFTVLFGDTWSEAGTIAQVMIPWLFFDFIVTPATSVYPVMNRHGIALFFQIVHFVASFFSIVIGAFYFSSLIVSMYFLSLSYSLTYLIRLVVTVRLCGRGFLEVMNNLLRPVPFALIGVSPYLILEFVSSRVHSLNLSGWGVLLSCGVVVSIMLYNGKMELHSC